MDTLTFIRSVRRLLLIYPELANRFESIGSEELGKRASATDEKVRNVNLAILIISVGLFYLASCVIVRALGKSKFNQ